MVDAVVQATIQKVGSLVVAEGIELFNIKKRIDEVHEKMKTLKPYLKDAESKADGDPAVAKFVIQIMDLFQDFEDILDTCARFNLSNNTNTNGSPLGYLKWASGVVLNCMEVRKINNNIKELMQKAEKVENSKGDLQPELSDPAAKIGSTEVWRERKKFLDADHHQPQMHGRDEIFEKLKKDMGKGNARTTISTIIGPGGVGKTTLARKLYKHLENDGFEHRVKVYVSKNPDVDGILREIADKVGLPKEKMNGNLDNNLYLHLKDKSYLIFLDDVWDTSTWNKLKYALMIKSEKGSRIIVTSRHSDVGRFIDGTAKFNDIESILETLDVLSGDFAKNFFKSIISDPDTQPLQDIGDKIVEKCGGLPLAIEVVGGMLRAKKPIVAAWSEVLEKMSDIKENECLKILALSYKDLPPKLKPLFLYLGIYPENHEIYVSQLIPLWVAENFIPDDRNQDDYVENQINELISRNLLQISRKKSDGRVRSCRVHSLVHELCRRLAEESNYFCTRNNLKSSEIFSGMRRRVTTNTTVLKENAFKDVNLQKLRALFCFTKDDNLIKFLKDNASQFKFLRLLIIENEDRKVVEVPREIADLNGLIFLKMIGNISEIPESIRRLKRLQTLEIKSKDIPQGILKMKHVKHLFLSCSIVVESKPRKLRCFKPRDANKSTDVNKELEIRTPNLESLEVDFGPNFSLSSSSLRKLTNIKSLGIYIWKEKMLEDVFPVEPVLPNLQDLRLSIYASLFDKDPTLKLSRYNNLKKLNLYLDSKRPLGGVGELFPRSVVKMSLRMVTNIEDHMDKLKRLSKLESLKLNKCKAKKLDFSGDGNFPQLQVLVLKYTDFEELKDLKKDEIPKLARFIFLPSPLSTYSKEPFPEGRLKKMMVSKDEEELLLLRRGDSMKNVPIIT